MKFTNWILLGLLLSGQAFAEESITIVGLDQNKTEFSKEDSRKMIQEVNQFNLDILFVGMTAPKQEKWVASNKSNLNATIIVSIGAVFDFYAGTVKRSSSFWIKIGLEWLPRLIKEPKRLWYRNFVSSPMFLWYLLRTKITNI